MPGTIRDATDDRRLGWALAAVGMLLVSFDAVFIRLAETDTWTIAFLYGVGSAVSLGLLATLRPSGRPLVTRGGGRARAPLVVIVVLSAATQLAFTAAVGNTAVANVVAIVASAPLTAAGLAWLVLRERPEGRVLVAIGAVLVGVGVVVSGSLGAPTLDGDLFALGAVAAFAGSVVAWRRHPELDRPRALAMGSALMALAAAPLADLGDAPTRAFVAIGAMALVVNPLGRIAYTTAPRHAPAAEVAIFAPVETVAATAWAWLAFGERPSTRTVAGGVIVIAAIVWSTLGRRDR